MARIPNERMTGGIEYSLIETIVFSLAMFHLSGVCVFCIGVLSLLVLCSSLFLAYYLFVSLL